MNNWIIAIIFTVAVNALVAFGSLQRTPVGMAIAICAVITVLLLVYTGDIKKTIPLYIFAVSLALMWQASMFGAHVIGSDMHGEFYASRIILQDGIWDFERHYGTQSSTSIIVGFVVPQLSKLLHVDIVWIYKAVLPVFFALTPVVLYFIYKQMIGRAYAFYAALFFMIVPITSLEIVQIGKSMVGELFMALAISCVVAISKKPWKSWESIQAITIFGIAAMLCHYTVGIALLAYLIAIAVIRFIPRLQILSRKVLPALVLLVAVVLIGGAGYFYYSIADEGVINRVMRNVFTSYSHEISGDVKDVAASIYLKPATDPKDFSGEPEKAYFDRHEVLVKTGIGMDLPQASVPGKAFRVIQYLTQFLICLGGLILFWAHRHYKFTAEFIAGIWASYGLLALCVFIPEFSNIINITRFYHFALFFLAPAFVIGAMHLFKKEWILVVLLIIYFAFTSGIVFEATKSNRISEIDTPYSVGLSAERTGAVGTYVRSDVMAVEWLEGVIQGDTMVVGDYNGWHLISSYLGLDRLREDKAVYNPTFDALPDKHCYIFVTDWNTRHQKYIASIKTIRGGAGLRNSFPMPRLDYPIVFQEGNAVIYYKAN